MSLIVLHLSGLRRAEDHHQSDYYECYCYYYHCHSIFIRMFTILLLLVPLLLLFHVLILRTLSAGTFRLFSHKPLTSRCSKGLRELHLRRARPRRRVGDALGTSRPLGGGIGTVLAGGVLYSIHFGRQRCFCCFPVHFASLGVLSAWRFSGSKQP